MFDLEASLEAARRQHAEGCVKTDEDLARYRKVIADSRPDGVIECGTFSGKSALWFARTAQAPVFTVDVHLQAAAATRREWAQNRVTFHLGRSTAADTVWHVREWMARWQVSRPLVVLDGDHSAATVRAEMEAYGPLVRPGGYMVVEDGIVRWMPHEWAENGGPYHGSPLDAIEDLLGAGYKWEIDEAVEGMFPATQFPSGWLRRTTA